MDFQVAVSEFQESTILRKACVVNVLLLLKSLAFTTFKHSEQLLKDN